ncbi:protein-tyrosine phosphatase-like protein [Morchella snyderi]|nr:protein-tyrosine phosphatase-like protein [Morchella snyderi]
MSPPTVYGNVIEYIADRLYLASYTAPPSSSTPFPPPAIPDPHKTTSQHIPSHISRTAHKRNKSAVVNSSGLKPVYFTVDDALLYNAFHHDFGPLHIGHLYRFAVTLHDILGDPKNEGRVVVFWSRPDGRARGNAGCLLACYMVLVQSWPPHLALSPLAQCDPPLMPFRDAGYSQADFVLNVQDVVYGVWKAKEKGIVNLREFGLDEYEKFERVDMGDFNWVSPNFLAFASPQYALPAPHKEQPFIPTNHDEILASGLPTPFRNVLEHFHTRDIGLVVRLNSHLYPAEYFSALGITHIDMIFDDGTCPPLNLVRKFINMAHNMITVHGKHIAVHCKAGLGRTGCLIGAYLIYRYGFTANEVIAYMRFMRPGMVVGPQQHWLHLNQGDFRQWWFEDTIMQAALEKQAMQLAPLRTPTKGKRVLSGTTPTKRSVLGEMAANETASQQILPAPTPGQPRKGSSRYATTTGSRRERPSSHTPQQPDSIEIHQDGDENDSVNASPIRRKKSSTIKMVEAEPEPTAADGNQMSEEEYLLRQYRRTTSKSPGGKRSVSYTTTTTTTVSHTVTPPSISPAEKAAQRNGNGIGIKVRSSPRRGAVTAAGVRKASGRVVSGGPPKGT